MQTSHNLISMDTFTWIVRECVDHKITVLLVQRGVSLTVILVRVGDMQYFFLMSTCDLVRAC